MKALLNYQIGRNIDVEDVKIHDVPMWSLKNFLKEEDKEDDGV